MPTTPGGQRRTRRGIAAAAWDRVDAARSAQSAQSAGDLAGWFADQAGLRGLETWPDAAGNLWALNGDPEEGSPDAHPGLVLAAPLTAGPADGTSSPRGPGRGLLLGLAVLDVLNQLGFEPESPVSLLARVGPTLPAEAEHPAQLLVELVTVAGDDPIAGVAAAGSTTLTRRLQVTGEPADGHDPLLTFAMSVLAVAKQARLAGAQARTTDVHVEAVDSLGRPTRLAADVSVAAAAEDDARTALAGLERQARDRADRDGTELVLAPMAPEPDAGTRAAAVLGLSDAAPAPTASADSAGFGGSGAHVTVELGVGAAPAAQVEALTHLVEEFAG